LGVGIWTGSAGNLPAVARPSRPRCGGGCGRPPLRLRSGQAPSRGDGGATLGEP